MSNNELFFYDSNRNKSYTYQQLIDDLNNSYDYFPICYINDFYLIFLNLIISLLLNKSIVLLDYDFSDNELNSLHFTKNGLQKKERFSLDPLEGIEDLLKRINNKKNWIITLFTSGTTGIPKIVKHNLSSLIRNVRISEKHIADNWGFAYNPTHIAGIQVFFQAFLNHNSIINIFGLDREIILSLIKNKNISHISATPTFFRLLRPIEDIYPSVKRLTSGGEKFDSQLMQELQPHFPNANIKNIYATTESGTLFNSDGNIFTVQDKFSEFIRVQNNELYIHENLLGESDFLLYDGEWYNSGDIVKVINLNPLQFSFVKRNNELINVGGYKVNPNEVEEVLNSNPSVLSSRVFSQKSSVVGNIIVAEIIRSNDSMDERTLRIFLQERLQPFKIPRIIKFVKQIETTRSGKIKRNE